MIAEDIENEIANESGQLVEDIFDSENVNQGGRTEVITSAGSSNYVKSITPFPSKKLCVFCNDDAISLGKLIGPFVLSLSEKEKTKCKRIFWAHEACAKFSPEVVAFKNRWFNVAEAVRRGRSLKCTSCRERGATIGCFEPKCDKSFHLPCTKKSLQAFEEGFIFWCPTHEAKYNNLETYHDQYSCDGCQMNLASESDELNGLPIFSWHTCAKCVSHFATFDLCKSCFTFSNVHHHSPENFFQTGKFST
jgi:hypothetical protein